MDLRTKRALWIIAGVVVFIALYRSHHITEAEVIVFCVIVPSIILHEVSHGVVFALSPTRHEQQPAVVRAFSQPE